MARKEIRSSHEIRQLHLREHSHLHPKARYLATAEFGNLMPLNVKETSRRGSRSLLPSPFAARQQYSKALTLRCYRAQKACHHGDA